MIFRQHVVDGAVGGYQAMSEYFRDIRAFFEVISVRFAIAEYGTRLAPVAGNELFSNANSYLLADDSSYPFYLWLPTWLGRFYVDPDRVRPARRWTSAAPATPGSSRSSGRGSGSTTPSSTTPTCPSAGSGSPPRGRTTPTSG